MVRSLHCMGSCGSLCRERVSILIVCFVLYANMVLWLLLRGKWPAYPSKNRLSRQHVACGSKKKYKIHKSDSIQRGIRTPAGKAHENAALYRASLRLSHTP